MIGRTYLERGQPVIVLIRWGKGGGPRNVLIRRNDETLVVRPFRGLRRPKSSPAVQEQFDLGDTAHASGDCDENNRKDSNT